MTARSPRNTVPLSLAPNGRVLIPAPMREALGLRNGGPVSARVEEGALIIEPRGAALRRARAMVARYVPQGADLAGELIAERRAAARRE